MNTFTSYIDAVRYAEQQTKAKREAHAIHLFRYDDQPFHVAELECGCNGILNGDTNIIAIYTTYAGLREKQFDTANLVEGVLA